MPEISLTPLIFSGLLAGAVNFFISYLELPFPKASVLEEGDWPKPRTLVIAIIGYAVVGVTGSLLTPLVNALVGELKGLITPDKKINTPVLFGYGIVFGYSTSRLLLSLLNSIIKKVDSVALRIHKFESRLNMSKLNLVSNAGKIIDECEANFEAYKSDCSGFVKSVAAAFSVTLTGQADDIVDQVSGAGWTPVANGTEAKDKADAGWLVIAGLRSKDNVPQQKNGHVVIVVSGPSAQDKYPSGYWGMLNGTGEKNKTINYAWNKNSRDKVTYAAKQI